MAMTHLHLHVADTERASAFYARYFGMRERVRHGDIVFVSDGRLDLALAPGEVIPFPAWFHFGFRFDSAGDVRALRAAMAASGASLVGDLGEEDDFVFFRCRDPDGHLIEVYWE